MSCVSFATEDNEGLRGIKVLKLIGGNIDLLFENNWSVLHISMFQEI